MSFSRSATSFFYRADTGRCIDRVAARESLVVYAGAGVSIDRSGMSWTDLIHNLLTHIEESSPEKAEQQRAIMKANTPLQAASFVSEKYRMKYPAAWKSKIILRLRDLLYIEQSWQRGGLISSIVQLAAAFRDRKQNFSIVTTNYDAFIQQAAEEANGETALELRTSVVPHDPKEEFEVARHTRPFTVVHLHGYVPSEKDDAERQDVIISELDYFRSHTRSAQILQELFRDNSVLIIGSSLTDPPLLEALASTARRSPTASRRMRLAVIPMQGLELPDDPEQIAAVQRSIRLRMQQFDTEVVFPDFFSQVPQLLTEIMLRMRSQAHPAALGYQLRAESWWKDWHTARSADLRRRQCRDHEFLEQELAEMVREFGLEDETLKLEMWIRWDPDHGRQLWLWASSTGSWPAMDSVRRAEIEADSRHVSVQAYCLGRPEIYRAADRNDRWRTYLCVPIRVGGRGEELPVGVISMASMEPVDRSKINESNGEGLTGVVERMAQAGVRLATPAAPAGT